MSGSNKTNNANCYRILLKETLDDTWSDWFGEMAISRNTNRQGRSVTVLTGPVADQAALRGLLNRIWDLNLTLLSVEQM